jgi:Fe2+ or Zn2+ uptake regulation protein
MDLNDALTIAQCSHAHLACKDCGAVIEVMDGGQL